MKYRSTFLALIALLFALPVAAADPLPRTESSVDEAMIRSARARSNQAIAAHDGVMLADTWLPEFWLVSSTNAQSAGRDAARARFVQLFATRPDVVYVREPDKIEVNVSWGQAGESGRFRLPALSLQDSQFSSITVPHVPWDRR